MPTLSRRDVLKISGTLAAGAALSKVTELFSPARSQPVDQPNILILVFDAMSARHLSLYGYRRETTPNLSRFAERAFVYHNHYSAGNFTTSGTASMLTGLYPWTHRAFNFRGMVDRRLVNRNLFTLLGREYTRLAFTQNLWADILLSQFEHDLDAHLPCALFSRDIYSLPQPSDLPGDRTLAYYVFQDLLNLRVNDPASFPGSVLLASADLSRALVAGESAVSAEYPRGLPTNYDFTYQHPNVFDGIAHLIRSNLVQASPYLAYFHLWSPHDPYNPRREFVGMFPEELKLQEKARHPLSGTTYSHASLLEYRRQYDEFIADVDAEFGRLISALQSSGALQNTYVIVTSDHGELFERGELGHASALMYASVTHIPLLISTPDQQTRSDVHTLTNNLDLLPTLLRIAGKESPEWAEGQILPGFGGTEDANRSFFPMGAKDNAAFRSIEHATFSLIKGGHELFFFTGYPGHQDGFELYNLQEDPDELRDLFRDDLTTASQMKDELLEAVQKANRNYQMNS